MRPGHDHDGRAVRRRVPVAMRRQSDMEPLEQRLHGLRGVRVLLARGGLHADLSNGANAVRQSVVMPHDHDNDNHDNDND